MPFSAHQNTIVTVGSPDIDLASWFIFRESNGLYYKVSNGTIATDPQITLNNGAWMGGFGSSGVTLFKLDANDNVINQTDFPISEAPALLSDNTLVYYNSTSAWFSSFVANNTDLTWAERPGFAAENITLNAYPFNSYVIDDNYIIWINASFYTFVYSRQQDGSWTQTDGFAFTSPVDSTSPFNMYFNGADTLIFSYPTTTFPASTSIGGLVLVTKVNNVWQTQVITADQIGLSVAANLGYRSFAALNKDTLAFGAPDQGLAKKRGNVVVPIPVGNVIIIQRRNNTWVPTAKLYAKENGVFGTSIGISDNQIVVSFWNSLPSSYNFQFYTVPLCVVQPINVTCVDQQVSTCQVDVSSTNVYSINDQCDGFNTEASITDINVKDYALSVTFEFNRAVSPSATCTSTLTCPRPPTTTTTPTTTPTKAVSSASVVSAVGTLVMLLALF